MIPYGYSSYTIKYNINCLSENIYYLLNKVIKYYKETDKQCFKIIFDNIYSLDKERYNEVFYGYNILVEYKNILCNIYSIDIYNDKNLVEHFNNNITDKIAEKILKDYYNKLPSEVNYNHILFEIIYKNPLKCLNIMNL